MKENSHLLIVNLTYLLCSSIEINSVSSWQVEMGKFLPSCSVRAGLWRVAFQLHFPLLNEQLKSDGLPWKKLIYFFSVDSYIYFPFLKEKKPWIKAKIKITEHKLWFIQSSIRESVLQSEVKIENLETNFSLSFKDKTMNQYLFTYNPVLLYFV